MHLVSTGHFPFFQRGAISSRVLMFNLSQLGIDTESFCSRFGALVRDAPFDQYDPALAAEEKVRAHALDVFEANENDWRNCWDTLHQPDSSDSRAPRGPVFWRDRLASHPLARTLNQMRAYRQRCCQRYRVSLGRRIGEWRITHLGNRAFTQQVPDARARLRRFSGFPDKVIYDDDLLQLLAFVCELVSRAPHIEQRSFVITAHLMLTHAGFEGSQPAPEGMHQDGSNYIVSALVLERRNVLGGASVINQWRKDGPSAVDSIVLTEGQGIFQADSDGHLFHGVTAVVANTPNVSAYRSILGFDIDYSE